MDSSRVKLQASIITIAFGIFGSVYVLKDDQLLNQIISFSALSLAAIAYLYALKQLKENLAITTGYLLLMAVIVRIAAIPVPIFIDDLLYRTLWDGWLQSNSLNPYLYRPTSEQLELLKSNDVRELIFKGTHYTSYSPLYEVIYRFTGWFYDHFGLAYAILLHKGLSIIIDVTAIYSLIMLTELTQKPKRYVAAFAWNPFMILFLTSQGLFVQISALVVVWFFYLIYRKNYKLAGLVWGLVMLSSPAGWLGLPLLAFGFYNGSKRWYFLGFSTFTYLAWWLPFLKVEAVQNYFLGMIIYWANGFTHLSAGHLILSLLPVESAYKSLIWFILIVLIYLSFLVYIQKKKSPLNDIQISHYLFLFCLAFFILSPVILLSLIPVVFVLSIYRGKYVALTAVISTLLLFNFGFWQFSVTIPALLFGLATLILFWLLIMKEKHSLGHQLIYW